MTGGVLFFLQSFATLLFGIEFRNIGVRMPILEFHEMYFSFARVLAFGIALVGMVTLYLFLSRTYLGTATRAIHQDREIMALLGIPAGVALAVLVVLVTGVVFYRLTEDWSLADSLYFTVIALSTIGFGDFAPTTTFSRLFTMLYAIIGVGLIGTLLNLVVTNAQQTLKQRGSDSDGPGN